MDLSRYGLRSWDLKSRGTRSFNRMKSVKLDSKIPKVSFLKTKCVRPKTGILLLSFNLLLANTSLCVPVITEVI